MAETNSGDSAEEAVENEKMCDLKDVQFHNTADNLNGKTYSEKGENHEYSEMTCIEPDNIDKDGHVPVPDGGWGWMVVFGCFITHVFLGGFNRSYGIMYMYIRSRFHTSAAIAAWIGGISTGLRMGCSPLSTGLSSRFSARAVVMMGGAILGLAIMVSGLAPGPEMLFLTLGVLAGFGGSLTYTPGLVIVGQYFDRFRAVATGTASMGSGVGVFLFPPMMTLLFSFYGFTGSFLLIGALELHHCIAGALYRPLEDQQPERRRKTSLKEEKSSGFAAFTKHLDLTLWLNHTFVCFALAMGFITTSYITAQMLLPDRAMFLGISQTQAAFLLSVVGMCDTVGRFLSGVVFDLPFVKPHRRHVFTLALFLSGLTHLIFGFSRTYTMLMVGAVLHGSITSIVVSARAVIVVDLLGVKNLPSGLGMAVFAQGVGVFVGPLVAGWSYDITGNYTWSYIFCFLCASIASLCLFVEPFITRCRSVRHDTSTNEDTVCEVKIKATDQVSVPDNCKL